jgi:putative membrane protein
VSFGLVEVNATLNATSAVLLATAFGFIKARKYKAHGITMIAATLVSAAFLACYLTYHYLHGEKSTKLHSGDWLRDVYLVVLLPHLFLAVVMLPMIYLALLNAYRRKWSAHRRIALPAFLVWMYVSFTGVVVYFMLYHTRLAF